MSKVIFDISLSLDGVMRAANPRPQEPLGERGERLHEWAFDGDDRDRQVLTEGVAETGAVITGRTNYDDSLPWWGPDGPTGPARLPVFVVTHEAPADAPDGGVYTFVTGGIERTLEQAREAAGGKGVTVMGGAETGRQFLRAGLVDEVSLHVVPLLLGAGTRMFEGLGDEPIELEPITTVQTPHATHLRLRVVSRR